MNLKQPLYFKPIYKEKMWGGERLRGLYGREILSPNIGESWELSGVSGNVSLCTATDMNGIDLKTLCRVAGVDLYGEALAEKYGEEFPLLIKFLDANKQLSLQVHPGDDQARKYGSWGKTECWYVLYAEKKANIIAGLKRQTSADEFKSLLDDDQLDKVLRYEPVQTGDFIYIPAGTIHAILGGTFLAEIQQTSDLTFRVSDWGRVGLDGKPRELHVKESIEAINYSDAGSHKVNVQSENLLSCPYFEVECYVLSKRRHLEFNSVRILMNVSQEKATLKTHSGDYLLSPGSTVLLPAVLREISIESSGAVVLNVTVK